ncbi:SigE family RNA polymerase sigma factor [Kineococcus sp. LSe6-4]|uniref:SigE family RNA polymerase sigma factor n=1 Tax=Kineococcus halophytocola TaxID=3234027 RepID=A0ABV4GYR6_9ACTN
MDGAEAFEAFYRTSSRRVLGHVYLSTGDFAASEDAVAEAFARAWQRWQAVSRADSPEAWVRTVAHRIAISQWRKLRNRLVAQRRAHEDGPLPALGPDHVALVAALRELPVRQRQAVVLHHLADRSVADIADELDVAEGTVKAWLSRGRTAMREHLQEDPR